ncbi:serine carboxypeptidase II-3-like [Cynara cardunculus var. scolymus]|uniref:serine carboxypeptidase II-3-like n=1 Tax=Cynara cardunculus var. scolymus TaxID=59895 RepID=UPI000D62E26A|nr:serine carboxypeptidase II-3-like [Cynara cardunculus var. scolymus]
MTLQIGNAWIDDSTSYEGMYDYYWTHALNSDETNAGINKNCDYVSGNFSDACYQYQSQGDGEYGGIDIYNIYAPLCDGSTQTPGSVKSFDPCSDGYVSSYLNRAEVQEALHVRNTSWTHCGGDIDGRVPVTSSRYSVNRLKLPIETAWRPWYYNEEVGGYVVGYKGVVLTTVRGAGHTVPSYQPERALVMISSFLQGKLPPPSTE